MARPTEILSAAEEIARGAGALLREHARRGVAVERKGDIDLVTQADRDSEAFIVREIQRRFPGHAILAEEGGLRRVSRDEFLWVVDPLDGTTNFAHGVPIWSVSLGVLRDGSPIAAVVYDPTRDECFTASHGGGAFLDGRAVRVSTATRLEEALLVTGFPYDIRISSADNLDHFARFMKQARAVRRLGSAALDLAWTACGRFDGFWELKLHPWDVAAGWLLVTEAGGEVTRFDGSAFAIDAPDILAAPPALAPALRAILAS
jgi:myo-inositol-1(or 4)-monophosphatase